MANMEILQKSGRVENQIKAEMRKKLVCNMHSSNDLEHKVFRSSLTGNARSGDFSGRCFISSPSYQARFYGEQQKQ